MRFRPLMAAGLIGVLVLVLGAGCSRDPEARKQRYLESGERYLQKGQYREAQLQFRNALGVDNHFAEGYYQFARSCIALQQWEIAVKALENVVTLAPKRVDARLALGQILLSARQLADAEQEAYAILEIDPRLPGAHELMGAVAFLRQDYRHAVDSYTTLIDLAPDDAVGYANLALVEIAIGRRDAAESHLQQALQLNPKLLTAYTNLSSLYGLENRLPRSQEVLQEGIRQNPDAEDLYLALAGILYAQGSRDEAAHWLQSLRAARGDSATLAGTIGDFYAVHNNPERAVAEYRHGLSLDPASVALRNGIAEVFLENGRTAEATGVNGEALQRDPHDPTARLQRARIWVGQGKINEAIADLQLQIADAPDSAATHYVLGIAYLQGGQSDLANAELQEAVRSSDFAPAWRSLAALHLDLGNLQLAREYAAHALKTAPGYDSAHLVLGLAMLRQGDPAGARQQFVQALQIAPGNAFNHVSLGETYAAEKNVAAAEKEYETALKLDPRSAPALEELAQLYAGSGHPEKSEARLRQQLAAFPGDAHAHVVLGSLLVRKKNYPEAMLEFEQAARVDPGYVPAYVQLGGVYRELHRNDEALAQFQKALELQPKLAVVQTVAGDICLEKQDLDAARRHYRQALAADPNLAAAAGNLAWVDAQQGTNLDEALDLARKAKQVAPEVDSITDTLAWVHYKRNSYAVAVPLFRECVRKEPAQPLYHYHLGLALLGEGDKPSARAELLAALHLHLAGSDAGQAQAILQKMQ